MSALVIVCGLAAEARIAAAPGVKIISAGGDARRLLAELDGLDGKPSGLLSFGLAGGLAPALAPGDVFVGDAIIASDGACYAAEPRWTSALRSGTGAARATIAGVDAPLAGAAAKRALHADTGASLVDMESHLVGRWARDHAVPFAALRVVADPAERSLPHAATVGMRADGRVDVAAVLKSLARHPGQVPSLIRTARDARAAFAALLRCRQCLGPGFALLDL